MLFATLEAMVGSSDVKLMVSTRDRPTLVTLSRLRNLASIAVRRRAASAAGSGTSSSPLDSRLFSHWTGGRSRRFGSLKLPAFCSAATCGLNSASLSRLSWLITRDCQLVGLDDLDFAFDDRLIDGNAGDQGLRH